MSTGIGDRSRAVSEATVTPGSSQEIGPDTPHGGAVADGDRIELVYTGDGDREVLAAREVTTP